MGMYDMKKRICFVSLVNLSGIPYLSKYVDLLDCEYDIIYWNRYGVEEKNGAQSAYALNFKVAKNCGKATKLIGYLKFKRFATRILKKNDYNTVVLLSGNVAVLLKSILLHKYEKQYVIDIRDYFKEYNRYYYNEERKVIEKSKLAVISSRAYKSFLPKHDYVVVHNSPKLSEDELCSFNKKRQVFKNERTDSRIVLSFIGAIRFFEQDMKILRYFGNDDRFLVRYIGVGSDLLKKKCEEEGIRNTFFHDRFSPEQTLDFYVETDFIINLYGSGTPLLDYALSNKLYYAAILGIPILVCPGTYMEEVAVRNGFGVAVDLDDEASKDSILGFATEDEQVKKNGESFVKTVIYDNSIWENEVRKAFA